MKLRSLRIFLFIVLVFSFADKTFAFDSTYAARLQASLNQIKSNYNMPGISAAVLVPRQGLWTGTAGISDSANVLNPDMVFGIGSITKNFTAAAVLKLQEMNMLNINDPIHMYLSNYNNIDSNITIKELLQHTSGVYNYTANSQFFNAINADPDSIWNPEDILQFILSPQFQHGTAWSYSNSNFILLQLIIKKVSGLSLSAFFQQTFFKPQNLNIVLYPYGELPGYLVHNWADLNGDGIYDDASFIPKNASFSAAAGAGALMTQPKILVNWGKAIFSGNVLTPQSLQQMTTFRNISSGAINGYGLGLMRYNNVAGRTIWGHGGNIFGYSSILLYSPEDSISVAICINRDLLTTNFGLPFMTTVLNELPSSIKPVSQEIPSAFELKQNYPNPFNPETTIEFKITETEFTGLNVYDINGRLIQTLVNEKLPAGIYKIKWNGMNASSGIYYYTLRTENFSQTKKMILVK